MEQKKEVKTIEKNPEENKIPEQPQLVEVPIFLTDADFNKMTYLNHLILTELNSKMDQILKIAKNEEEVK